MDDRWFATLVVILSVMLALFLLLSIILLVRIIQISNQIKRITDHAEAAIDKAEQVADFFQKTTTPVALMKLISNISDVVTKTADKVNRKRK